MIIQIKNYQKMVKIRIIPLKILSKKICSLLGIRQGIISIVLTDNKKITLLNKKYFYKNYPTDVLSFNLEDSFDPFGIVGEIIISIEKALENSKFFYNDIKNEITLYIIHGLLHLIGFQDSTSFKKEKMRKKENELLSILNKKEKFLIKSLID